MMKFSLVLPCVGCCALLVYASSIQRLRGAEASVASGNLALSGSAGQLNVPAESPPPSASAAAVVHSPPSRTEGQPQNTPTTTAASAVSAREAPPPVTPTHTGPISTIGTLLLTLSPNVSWINDLFLPRPPQAVQAAETTHRSGTPANSTEAAAVADISLKADAARPGWQTTPSTTKPLVASAAASAAPLPAARGTGRRTSGLRVRRLQTGRHDTSRAGEHEDEERTGAYGNGKGDNEERSGSDGDAEEKDTEKSGSPRQAEATSDDLPTNTDTEHGKGDALVTEDHRNNEEDSADEASPEVQKADNEGLESADLIARPAGTGSGTAEKETRDQAEERGTVKTTDVSKEDSNNSKKEAASSSLPIAQLCEQTSANVAPPVEHADSTKDRSGSSPPRNARPHTGYYGGGPTFSPPVAFGSMPLRKAPVAPISIAIPPPQVQMVQAAPVQMVQAAPMQMVQAAPVQMVQAAPMQLVQAAPVQLIQATPVQLIQTEAVAVQGAGPTVQAAVPVQAAATPVAAVTPAMAALDTPVVGVPAVAMARTAAVATPLVNTAATAVPVVAAAPTAAAVI